MIKECFPFKKLNTKTPFEHAVQLFERQKQRK